MKHGLSLAILALFAVACTGPAGIAGPQGSTGATGTQGYAGVTGSQGQAGMTGADRKSTRLNSSHMVQSRMPSSA